MTIKIDTAGLQTTLQAGPRLGQRHNGVPACGAADPLSLALANRLLDNDLLATAFEVTLTKFAFTSEVAIGIAITGASAACTVNGDSIPQHAVINLKRGDSVVINALSLGMRCYVAIAGGLCGKDILQSESTYLPAAIGGYDGRELRVGDVVRCRAPRIAKQAETPQRFRLLVTPSSSLRAVPSFEAQQLENLSALFDARFRVSEQGTRMGVPLNGNELSILSAGKMASAPVFPGTVQCPESGTPVVLGVDAQTTGGYPRIAQVTRGDRHMIGQLRPGSDLRFLERTTEIAMLEYRDKLEFWSEWLPQIEQVL